MHKIRDLPVLSSLRGRAVILVLLAVIPALILILYSNLSIRQSNIEQAHLDTLRVAQLGAQQHELLVEGARQVLLGLAQIPQLHSRNDSSCAAILASLTSEDSRYTNFGLVDPDGRIICSAVPLEQPTSVAGSPWFRDSLKTLAFTAGAYTFDPITKKSVLTASFPLIEPTTQQIQTILFLTLDLSWFDRLTVNSQLPADSAISLIDQNGTILARQPDPEQWVGQTLPEAPVAQAITEQNGDGTTEGIGVDGVSRLYGFTPLLPISPTNPVYIAVGIPAATTLAEPNRLTLFNLTTLGIVLVMTLLLAWTGVDLIFLRQIKTLVAASRRLAAGDFNARSGLSYTSGEFTELARAFDEMATTLQSSQTRLSGIINISEDAIIATNAEQIITLFSQGAVRIFGYEPAEVQGQPVDILLPLKYRDVHHRHILNFIASGDALRPMNVRGAVFGRRKDGSEFPAEASISQFQVEGETMLVVRLRDITERLQTEEELQEYRVHLEERVETRTAELVRLVNRLEREITERKRIETELQKARQIAEIANRTKSEFLAHMSHELRTPLNAILGYGQILNREAHQRSEADAGWCRAGLATIQRSGEHLLTLINDILDLSKIEAGRMELHTVMFHPNEFLQMVADMARIQAEQKGLSFHYDLRSPLPSGVRGDPRRLRQILLNLLGNAIKFTEEGQISFIVTTEEVNGSSETENERQFHFEIVDTGIGIAPEQLEDIFQPFRQVDEQHYFEGAGLGLPISRRLAELMGGQVEAKSQTGRGSTFSLQIKLPLVADWADQPAAGEVIGFQGQPYKILVVDDNRDNRAVLNQLLTPLGFDVSEAADGAGALRAADKLEPDVILLDLIMPGLSGLEVTQALRQSTRFQDTVIIAVSASAFGITRQQSLTAGCTDFLSKPVEVTSLLDMLQRHLGLIWIYDPHQVQKRPEPVKQAVSLPELAQEPTPMVGPPPAQAALLFELAQMGDVVEIRSLLTQLQEQDERLRDFVTEARNLSRSFDMNEICELVKPYMEAGYGI